VTSQARSTTCQEEEGGTSQEDISAASDNELVKLVNKIIIDAYNQGATGNHRHEDGPVGMRRVILQ
jgi:hypothetical protein